MEGHTFSNSDILYISINYGLGYKLPPLNLFRDQTLEVMLADSSYG